MTFFSEGVIARAYSPLLREFVKPHHVYCDVFGFEIFRCTTQSGKEMLFRKSELWFVYQAPQESAAKGEQLP